MSDLMQKLAISKAIMDKTEGIKRNSLPQNQESNVLSDFDVPAAKYNIPSGMLDESSITTTKKEVKPLTIDAIKNSKLPEEIKKLMIENPIQQPSQYQSPISDEIVEKATRLMREQNPNSYPTESTKSKNNTTKDSNVNLQQIKEIVRSTVEEVLKENGLIVENLEKTNEIFSFKVGKHVFEGKVTKIKKLQ